MPEQPAEPSHVELDFLELTSPVGFRTFCQRSHCGERARHWETGFGRKLDQRGTLVAADGIGLIAPIKKMGIRPHRVIAVLCSVVVCKEAFRFFVDAATFEVGQCTEQKARHSAIRSNLLAHFNLNVAVYYCLRRGKRKMRSWANCRHPEAISRPLGRKVGFPSK